MDANAKAIAARMSYSLFDDNAAQILDSGPNLIYVDILYRTGDDAHMFAARPPKLWVGRSEDRDYRRAHGRGQVRDAGIVANVDARASKPTRQVPQVLHSHRVIQSFFRTGAPLHFHGQAARQFAVSIQRPILARAAGEWMHHGEIAPLSKRAVNAWHRWSGAS